MAPRAANAGAATPPTGKESIVPPQPSRSAHLRVSKSRGCEFAAISPGRQVWVYPNCVTIMQDGERVISLTPEEWGRAVQFVGIAGCDDLEPSGAKREQGA